LFDYSPADDNSESAYIDSALYSDQTADISSPYGANGWGRSVYIVTSQLNGKESDVYEGGDYDKAEQMAISAFERSHRKAYVTVYLDGGSWRDVKAYPKHLAPNAKPVVTDAGGCLHPQCGEIHPLSCYCRYDMTPAEIERWKEYA
jgi:hypothetical protein